MSGNGVASSTLSSRALDSLAFTNMIACLKDKCTENLYNGESNPEGIVNMGIAENHLCVPLCRERLSRADMHVVTDDMLQYFDPIGKYELRQTICRFFDRYFEPAEQLDPDDVYITNGATGALDLCAYLFADTDECFLVLAPCYAVFTVDFNRRWNVRLIPVQVDITMFNREVTESDIQQVVRDLEDAHTKATQEGKKIRGLLVTNPHNPSGVIMPLVMIESILDFTNRYDIHAVMDEIYALSIIDEDAKFDSILKIKDLPNKDKTHFVWSVSKDFGIAGLRCGVFYSRNKELRPVVPDFVHFGEMPLMQQHKIQVLLSDFDWVDMFLGRIKTLMRESCDYCISQLDELNIPYIRPRAGYFLWTDMSKFLKEKTFEAELEFTRELMAGGLFVLPGQYQDTSEPGWMRFTFTHPVPYLQKGFMNLKKFLKQQ